MNSVQSPDLRERYVIEGEGRFEDEELLALVIGTGSSRRTARQVAALLLCSLGGVDAVLRAPVEALLSVPGIGIAQATRLHAALRLAERCRPPRRPIVRGVNDVVALFTPIFMPLNHEELHGLYLNGHGRVLAIRRLAMGDGSNVLMDPKWVLRPAVQLGASAVILAHNHPCGDPSPSMRDYECTMRVHAAAEMLGTQLFDHVVFAPPEHSSFRALGMLPMIRRELAGGYALSPSEGALYEADDQRP
ncbi:MAG: DNA repair protein RadC [Deltaproteobacteria bacterium]|nr:DNA repair protein RadC [Deltaproteobacteria bacterium]